MNNLSERWTFSDADGPPAPQSAPQAGAATSVQEEPDDNARVPLVPRAWFGTATTPLPDPAEGDEEDPDDEELDETPPDVIAMLGFDPLDDADDEDDGDDTEAPPDPKNKDDTDG